MSGGWYFVLGCFSGSCWTLAIPRVFRLPTWRFPSLRPKYATVTVGDTDNYKIAAIKEIRVVTHLGLKEAKDVSEGMPVTLSRDAAQDLVTRLRKLGVGATFTPTRRATA